MADFVPPLDNLPIISSASSSSSAAAALPDAVVLSTHGGDDLGEEDACSICLEPFDPKDPPTVTSCRHEYHLQCILEWSQRSKECPICWQLLILKDPASQELLAAVENERILRSKRNVVHVHEDYETYLGNVYTDDSEFEERIMRHFAAATRRARHVNRRGRQRLSGVDHSTVPFPVPTSQLDSSSEEPRSSRYSNGEGGSPTINTLPVEHAEGRYELDPSEYWTSELPSENPKSPSSSEFIAFSESIKSKFSAASARYKESISKKTQGLKEKLLARNVSVKELGKGVQREMSAGIAGFARMIDRLELASKKAAVSVPSLNSPEGTSKEKNIQEGPLAGNAGEPTRCLSSSASACVEVPSVGH